MTPEALCIEGCGRPAKPGYRGWCKPCGDTPIEPGPLPATPDLCVAEGCDEWTINFDTLCVKHRAFEEWRQSGKKAGTKLRRGRRFGRLKTIERVDDYLSWDGYEQRVVPFARWRCACDCGNVVTTTETKMLIGETRSCGCYQRDKTSQARLIDLTGQRFHRLVVVSRGPNNRSNRSQWWCRCDCGEMSLVTGINLKTGHTRSCGCLIRERLQNSREDLAGMRFGRWTVIRFLEGRKYLCRCDCGTERAVYNSNLSGGLSQSCGCLKVERTKERWRAARQ